MIYRTVEYLATGELKEEPSVREKMDVCLLHFERLLQLKGKELQYGKCVSMHHGI